MKLLSGLRETDQTGRIVRNVGFRGALNSLYKSYRYAGRPLALILGKRTRADISSSATVDVGAHFLLDAYNNRMVDQALGGSYLYVGPGATFRIECETPVFVGSCSVIVVEGTFTMGDSYINGQTKIVCRNEITIGDGCAIAWNVTILDDHGGHHLEYEDGTYTDSEPVTIGDRVWIGHDVTVRPGVTVGDGAVVASNSLVADDVPTNSLVGGVPAEVIRENVKWDA